MHFFWTGSQFSWTGAACNFGSSSETVVSLVPHSDNSWTVSFKWLLFCMGEFKETTQSTSIFLWRDCERLTKHPQTIAHCVDGCRMWRDRRISALRLFFDFDFVGEMFFDSDSKWQDTLGTEASLPLLSFLWMELEERLPCLEYWRQSFDSIRAASLAGIIFSWAYEAVMFPLLAAKSSARGCSLFMDPNRWYHEANWKGGSNVDVSLLYLLAIVVDFRTPRAA